MKRYFLSIMAVAIAVALSAFTSGSDNHTNKPQRLTNLYWYLFDGTKITTQVGSGTMDKSSAESATSCSDNVSAPVCSYGYTSEQTGLPKLPGSFSDKIRKTN